VFKVAPFATKANIKKSIEKLFKVNVTKVNTINLHPRFKMVRGRVAKSSGYKKAIVTLKKGQSIDITTGI
jgi:large subunit ribosomal protein L23